MTNILLEGLVMIEDSNGFTLTDCRICSWILSLLIVSLTSLESPDLHSFQTAAAASWFWCPARWKQSPLLGYYCLTQHVPSEHLVLKVTGSKPAKFGHRDLSRFFWDQPQAIYGMWYTTLRDLYALMVSFLHVNYVFIHPYAVLFWGTIFVYFSGGLSPGEQPHF